MIDTSQDLVARYLVPNETLLWTGRPKQGLLLRPGDGFAIPFSLLWSGLVVRSAYNAFVSDSSILLRLFFIPFTLMGFYVLFGRFLVDAWLRSRTIYALTSQRVIVVTQSIHTDVVSLALARLPQLTLSEGSGGRGTITSGRPEAWIAASYGWPGFGQSQPSAFEDIAGVRQVYDQILLAQRRASTPAA
jgi:hypothetical protein